jgi:hypothetical protein
VSSAKIYEVGAQFNVDQRRQRFSLRSIMQTKLHDWLVGDTSIFGVGIQHWMPIVVFVVAVFFAFSKLCEQRTRD